MKQTRRLTIDVPRDTHDYWKMLAITDNSTLRELVLKCMPEPDKVMSRSELMEKSYKEVFQDFKVVFDNLKDR